MNVGSGACPARFWPRAAAWSLDAALLALPALILTWPWIAAPLQAVRAHWDVLLQATGTAVAGAVLRAGDGGPAELLALAFGLVHDPALQVANARLSSALWSAAWPPLIAFVLLATAWQTGFESSRWQASPGRRALGLRVEDDGGQRLSGWRALARHGAGALSWLTLNIGHLMAASAPRHRALHDRLSGTRVRAGGTALPGWAVAWLALLVAAALALGAWLVHDASKTMRAALEAALW